jgi:hypothetical protein
MRRLLTWLLVTVGIAAVARRLRRKPAALPTPSTQEPDPADELRRKLSASRAEPETEPEPEPAEKTVDEQRAKVHEQGRSTLDEMRATDE